MDWKASAIDDLRRYNYIKIGILNSKDKLRTIEAASKSGRLSSEGGKGASFDSKLVDAIVESERLKKNIEVSKELTKMIDRGLDALTDAERCVLREFYMNDTDTNISKLKEKLGYETRSIYRLRDRALSKFTLAMYGVGTF